MRRSNRFLCLAGEVQHNRAREILYLTVTRTKRRRKKQSDENDRESATERERESESERESERENKYGGIRERAHGMFFLPIQRTI